MAPNPLHNPENALRFAVEFAQADIDQLGPDEYLALIKHANALIHREHPGPNWRSEPFLNDKELAYLQQRTAELLTGIASEGTFTVANDLLLTFMGIRDGTGLHIVVVGSPLDRLLYQIIRVLEVVGAERLLVCPAPDCGRLFLKVTKKKFCSSRCQSRVYMRKYRQE